MLLDSRWWSSDMFTWDDSSPTGPHIFRLKSPTRYAATIVGRPAATPAGGEPVLGHRGGAPSALACARAACRAQCFGERDVDAMNKERRPSGLESDS